MAYVSGKCVDRRDNGELVVAELPAHYYPLEVSVAVTEETDFIVKA